MEWWVVVGWLQKLPTIRMKGYHHLEPCRDVLRPPLVPLNIKIMLQQQPAPGRHLVGLHVGGRKGVTMGRGGHLLEGLIG